MLCWSKLRRANFGGCACAKISVMKRRKVAAFAIVPLIGLFLWAREAASWRPKTLIADEFYHRMLPPPTVTFYMSNLKAWETDLTPQQRRMARDERIKGWEIQAFSPNNQLAFAGNKTTKAVAILDAHTGKVRTKLPFQTSDLCFDPESFVGGAQFSPDGRTFSLSEIPGEVTRVFDTQTGKLLWQGDLLSAEFRFSPDGQWSAIEGHYRKVISIRETRTGREVRQLMTETYRQNWNFSLDGNSMLAETEMDKFQQWRLR